jgi:phosphate transport system permease protein
MIRRIFGTSFFLLSLASAAVIVTAIILFMITLLIGGWDHLTWKFLTSAPEEGMTAGGIFPAIVGTVFLVLLMSLAGVPIGTITAIYLSEYANKNSIFTKMIRFAVNTLAGVPAIVFGLFGVGFFIQFVGGGLDNMFSGNEMHWRQGNILWASLTMALLTLPVVIVSVEESLRSVPKEYREGSLALGATKFQTVVKIVLPNAYTGILTGTILAVGRGAGEVAPILFTGVAYYLPHLPTSLSDQFMQLGYHLYIMATQSPDVEATMGIQYATAFVLLALTFLLNFTAIIIRSRLRARAN